MNSFKLSVTSFFLGIVLILAGMTFSGCLDLPSKPHSITPISKVSLMVIQNGIVDSTYLKINPQDSAKLIAKITPKSYTEDLTIDWVLSENSKDSILYSGDTFSIPKRATVIPNKVVLTDKSHNQLAKDFSIIVNTIPYFGSYTHPAQNDTIYATPATAIEFKWISYDYDLTRGDNITHILEIDGVEYNVGSLSRVEQSGFKSGQHKFRVIVTDSYASSDTLPMRKFTVIDTTGGKS